MRVTYQRELKIRAYLDTIGIESFIPMCYQLTENNKGGVNRTLVPAIHNLIFVRSTRERLTALKSSRRELSPLRYIMRPAASGRGEVLVVPDRQMENFLRVARVCDDSVMFLEYSDFIRKEGRRVRVRGGAFAGVEGVVKRIRNNRHVVVQIEGVAAVAITFVPPALLEFVGE